MAVLKRLKASTLMETMVATVLLVIIFMIASALLNSLFGRYVAGDTHTVRTRIHEMEYQFQNNPQPFELPYTEEWQEWTIDLYRENGVVVIEALHRDSIQHLKSFIVPHEIAP